MTTRDPAKRGDETTRIEAFVDAAFAFALTLLAIGGDHRTGHTDWSRRYGLDDAASSGWLLGVPGCLYFSLSLIRPLHSRYAARAWRKR